MLISYIFPILLHYSLLISIPFKTHHLFNNKIRSAHTLNQSDFIMSNLSNNLIYITLYVGTPKQEVHFLLSNSERSFVIKENQCLIKEAKFDLFKSKTLVDSNLCDSVYKYEYYNDKCMIKSSKLEDIFFQYSNASSYHSPGQKTTENTCGFLSLKFFSIKNLMKNSREIPLFLKSNFFYQQNKLTFSVYYKNDDEGILNLSTDFLTDDVSYRSVQVEDLPYENSNKEWNLKFDKIYFYENGEEVKLKYNFDSHPYIHATLMHDFGIVKGNYDYQKKIEKHLFNDLISQGFCQKRETAKYYYFLCKEEIEEHLQSHFQTIHFYSKNLDYDFELSYDDVFKKINGKIFFLVTFDKYLIELFDGAYMYIDKWELGKPFIKKYFFVYDFESESITFLEKSSVNFDEKKGWGVGKYMVLLFIAAVSVVGFYVGKNYKRIKDCFYKRGGFVGTELAESINEK